MALFTRVPRAVLEMNDPGSRSRDHLRVPPLPEKEAEMHGVQKVNLFEKRSRRAFSQKVPARRDFGTSRARSPKNEEPEVGRVADRSRYVVENGHESPLVPSKTRNDAHRPSSCS